MGYLLSQKINMNYIFQCLVQTLKHSIQGNRLFFFNFAEIIYSLYIKASNYGSQKLLINTVHILCIGRFDSVQVPLSMDVLGEIYIAIWLFWDW